ncbi:VCBS repeat-containing protein [Streptomyces sp. NPDC006798]|uniref:VCBS repeat-containing protein n=1 Tax=Streptomyces sp. NPDC006798 TaxID=3155462 RepID=UPI0034066A2D
MAGAGRVTVVYGGAKGVVHLAQGAAGIPGAPEAADRYGHALAVYDADLDGCSDLVIGTPYEDLDTIVDTGLVHIVYGSPTGLNSGKPVKEHLQGTGRPLGGSPEPGDWTGYALTAGKTSAGAPFLVIGAPGESIGSAEDAGHFFYIHGTAQTTAVVSQDTGNGGDVPGVAERGDRYAAALSSTPHQFAVSAPGESLGQVTFAGVIAVFSHTLVAGYPKPLLGLGQDAASVTGVEERGDGFGTALAMIPYRAGVLHPADQSLITVGVPGEDLSTTVDAGAVQTFRVTSGGGFAEDAWIDQNVTDVEGEADAGDFFGQRLAAVNTASGVATPTATRLAVGVPGEESAEEHRDKGGVQIVPLIGPVGLTDQWIEPGHGIPGQPAPRQLAGMSVGAAPEGLLVGMPYGPPEGRAVHIFDWNVPSGGAPTRTLRPGEGGIPADGTAWGAVVR